MFHRMILAGGLAAAAGSAAHALTLYIDPVNGNDAADGSRNTPWKSFEPLNKRTMQAGDEVVVFPGVLTASLAPQGNGTAENPVKINFRPGRYDWVPADLVHRKLHISNTNDRPDEPKAIAMELAGVQHYRVCGQDAAFFCRGKMIEIHLEECDDVSFSGFSFDYVRPTVNEYTAVEVTPEYVELELHPDSLYRIEDGQLVWVGEGWEFPAGEGWAQTLSADKKSVRRGGPKIAGGKVEEVAPRRLRLTNAGNHGFEKGRSYQHRRHVRDCCGVFCDRSSNISYKDVTFHFMHGMGVVSQFSRDLHYENLRVYPRPESGRTSSAWADVTHFSGCYGQITLENCYLTGANDDAINIHGTHLRLVARQDDRHITVRFMNGQTFGFNAFRPGDAVQYTATPTLQGLGTGKVAEARLSDDGREMHLVMEEPVPAAAEVDKTVLENLTATAAVTVRNTHVTMIDTRGFLLTTRKPILIENCYFHSTGMPALLMEDDANYWYESGPVHNMTVRGCTFDHCAEPVISFNPQVQEGAEPVHRNIRIEGNRFILDKDYYLDMKWVDGLISAGNVFELPEGNTPRSTQKNCRGVDITD
ncbi:MAG: right-handed parallel beta-helix repeat-containing protein [Akkermansia sp.]|nr:right-handed parallel beta-helix repeat-containing protein [Akkermansia sp.]